MNNCKTSKTKCYTSVTNDKLNEAIKAKARELYEKSGRKPGHDMDNWLAAEKMVKSQLCGSTQHMSC